MASQDEKISKDVSQQLGLKNKNKEVLQKLGLEKTLVMRLRANNYSTLVHIKGHGSVLQDVLEITVEGDCGGEDNITCL